MTELIRVESGGQLWLVRYPHRDNADLYGVLNGIIHCYRCDAELSTEDLESVLGHLRVHAGPSAHLVDQTLKALEGLR